MSKERLDIVAQSDVRPVDLVISKELRPRLASSMREAYDTALSARDGLDWMITEAERNYEMMTIPRVYPWKDAANVFLPIIPEQVDTLVSSIISDVFVPSFFLVVGNTMSAAQVSHKVQRFYNAELTRPRSVGSNTWVEEAHTWTHLSALHGTAYLDVTWLRKTSKQRFSVLVRDEDESTGLPVLDLESGEQTQRWETHEVDVTEYDDVRWESLELREVILVPPRAKSVEEADMRIRVMYYTESDLRSMVRAGLLWKEETEEVIKGSIARGDTERNQDPRGVETWTIGDQVNVTPSTTDGVNDRLKSTEYEVLRVETKAYALTPDGPPEHVIYYLHRNPQYLMGAIRFPYNHGRSTLVSLALLKRPNRAYGYGVPERLRSIQIEANALENQMLDQGNIRLSPPRYQTAGVKVLNGEDGAWGPNTVLLVTSKDDVGILPMGDVIPSSSQQLDRLFSMAGRIAGQSSFATGALSSGRKTKAEITQASRGQNIRGSFYANSVRLSMSKVFWLTHWLKIQYAPEKIEVNTTGYGGVPERLEIAKEDLVQDFDLLIAGMGGPMDKEGDRQDSMLLHQMFTARPDIQQDPVKLYAFDRMVLDAFQRPDVELLIGTPQAAQERAQQMQQAAAHAQMLQQMGMQPPGQGGKPGAPGAKPQQGPPQQQHPGLGGAPQLGR